MVRLLWFNPTNALNDQDILRRAKESAHLQYGNGPGHQACAGKLDQWVNPVALNRDPPCSMFRVMTVDVQQSSLQCAAKKLQSKDKETTGCQAPPHGA